MKYHGKKIKAFKPTRYPKISIAIDTDGSRKSSVHPWLTYPQLEHGLPDQSLMHITVLELKAIL